MGSRDAALNTAWGRGSSVPPSSAGAGGGGGGGGGGEVGAKMERGEVVVEGRW